MKSLPAREGRALDSTGDVDVLSLVGDKAVRLALPLFRVAMGTDGPSLGIDPTGLLRDPYFAGFLTFSVIDGVQSELRIRLDMKEEVIG